MDFDYTRALSNLHNVVVALNCGGVKTCAQIAELIWEEAPEWKRQDKVNRPRDSANRTEAYARNQIRQEIRRSLYNHFSDPEASGFHIFRCQALYDSERFWVAEEQELPVQVIPGLAADYDGNADNFALFDTAAVQVESMATPEVEVVATSPTAVEIRPNASLIERLNAANNTIFPTAGLLREAMDNSNGEEFNNPNMPTEMCAVLTETLGNEFIGMENTPSNRRAVSDRVMEIIAELEGTNEQCQTSDF